MYKTILSFLFRRNKKTVPASWSINYDFKGAVKYQSYIEVEERISKFKHTAVIGTDSSKKYNMYLIEMGNRNKPCIMILAGLHGSEWQSTQYCLEFMEQIRDNIFPDKKFREEILNNFHIAFIPVGNPWGYDNTSPFSRLKGRNNANGVNLNRDFNDFSQSESQNIRKVAERLKPFSYLDCHLIAPRKDGGQNYEDIIIGNMTDDTNKIRDFIANSLTLYANRPVGKWDKWTNDNHTGLSRRYMSNLDNPNTSKTWSFIFEMYRPVKNKQEIVRILTDQEIMKYGLAGLYLFFLASSNYLCNNK
ncbi:M14 family zinc carboxypeptidase [Evansella clarkii]|uniref:M14 family zinc carboxypeptidase n=1 Tax=Evansella clarkii TaxID=79879 RepID=UPI000B42E259|nr:M14 family zinc carboxypeptidase [Evansella clarkii]